VARIAGRRTTATDPPADAGVNLIVRVLGSAAGGGVPQWNCACANCSAVRDGSRPLRTQSSFALSADGERWYLVNISPDVAFQIERYGPLQPRSTRGTPIAGVLLTDANVDHIGGLAVVRQQGDHCFTIRSSALVREIAVRQPAFAPFAQAPHRWISVNDGAASVPEFDGDSIGEALDVRALFVPGLTPGFDGRHATPGAVVAYEVHDRRSGGRAVFAPVFAGMNRALIDALERADVAFLDGSFFSDDELPGLGLGEKTARALGHQPVDGADGTLAAVSALKNRRIFAHLNNSNPMLDPDSPAALAVAETGAEVSYDGMELRL
jgi:pyrroloquinoline quinone biosynthesis protein B